jgi:hypothetical protein
MSPAPHYNFLVIDKGAVLTASYQGVFGLFMPSKIEM